MGENNPRYLQAWFGSYAEVQQLPKPMQRVLQTALKNQRLAHGPFLVSMGRLLRYCDIGTPCRARSRLAAAVLLEDKVAVDAAAWHSQELALRFSQAFRSLRYRERHAWTESMPSALAIVLARDDLESLRQAIRRGVIFPDEVADPVLKYAHAKTRAEIDDHIQTIDALHDDVLDSLIGHQMVHIPPDPAEEFLWDLVPVEPVCWWLASWWLNRPRNLRPR